MNAEHRRGVAFALACYGTWGLFPAFWKLVATVQPAEVLAHRVVWSLVVVCLLLWWKGRWGEVLALLESRRRIAVLAASTLCISVNWLIFIQVVGEGNVLEASMGYFLNPLVNVALGVAVLKERLRPLQWTAVGLALAGILELAIATGTPPWAALTLAGTFGIYGLLRKRLPVTPLTGLAVETGLMFPVAVAYLAWRAAQGAPFMGGTTELAAALLAGGPVTAAPLLWFAAAAARLRYTTLGFFQYMAPTGHFLLAVLAYGEHPGPHHLITFGCIWAAIGLYIYDGWRESLRPAAA
jgi:chloramphenicol-sensitive protein RarD